VPAGNTPLRTYFMKSFLDAMPCMWIWQKKTAKENGLWYYCQNEQAINHLPLWHERGVLHLLDESKLLTALNSKHMERDIRN
jgi:hypothetical protein